MPVVIHDVEQGTDGWKKLREPRYTGVDAHKLFKFGRVPYSKTQDTGWKGNFYTERGHELEKEAIELYERIYKVDVLKVGFVTNTKYPDCGYSPDGIHGDILLECKGFKGDKHLAVAEYTKFEIMAQIEFGKCITDLKKGRLLLYNPDLGVENALIIVEIPFNRAIQSNLHNILGGR